MTFIDRLSWKRYVVFAVTAVTLFFISDQLFARLHLLYLCQTKGGRLMDFSEPVEGFVAGYPYEGDVDCNPDCIFLLNFGYGYIEISQSRRDQPMGAQDGFQRFYFPTTENPNCQLFPESHPRSGEPIVSERGAEFGTPSWFIPKGRCIAAINVREPTSEYELELIPGAKVTLENRYYRIRETNIYGTEVLTGKRVAHYRSYFLSTYKESNLSRLLFTIFNPKNGAVFCNKFNFVNAMLDAFPPKN